MVISQRFCVIIIIYQLRLKAVRCYPHAVTQVSKNTRDFLLRGFPIDLQDKLKAAAAIERKPSLREYILHVLAIHVKD
jgi:hypothetical protein